MDNIETHERLARLETECKAQTKILTEICRDTKANRRDAVKHELSDEKRFGKLESDARWTKVIGSAFISALHFWR